jgi:hypothetical protein
VTDQDVGDRAGDDEHVVGHPGRLRLEPIDHPVVIRVEVARMLGGAGQVPQAAHLVDRGDAEAPGGVAAGQPDRVVRGAVDDRGPELAGSADDRRRRRRLVGGDVERRDPLLAGRAEAVGDPIDPGRPSDRVHREVLVAIVRVAEPGRHRHVPALVAQRPHQPVGADRVAARVVGQALAGVVEDPAGHRGPGPRQRLARRDAAGQQALVEREPRRRLAGGGEDLERPRDLAGLLQPPGGGAGQPAAGTALEPPDRLERRRAHPIDPVRAQVRRHHLGEPTAEPDPGRPHQV